MLNIHEVWGLMLYAIVFLALAVVLVPFFKWYRYSKGEHRKITGEVMRDIGIALMVGTALKYSITELIFYVIFIVSAILIFLGVIMKEDGK